jgi:hypothetical protein
MNYFNGFPLVYGRIIEKIIPIAAPIAKRTEISKALLFFIWPINIGVHVEAIEPMAEETPKPSPTI